MILLDSKSGKLEALVSQQEWDLRQPLKRYEQKVFGYGRELFANFRNVASSAEKGAMSFGEDFI